MKQKKSFPLIKRSGELNWLFGVFLVALGVAICNKADLGVSMIAAPAFIIHDAILPLVPALSVGVIEYLVQGVVILITCLIAKHFDWRYLLSFLTAVIYGYVIDMWMLILGTEPFAHLWLRWVMLIVGDIVTCVGVAFFFRTFLPLEAYELCVHEAVRVHKFNPHHVKWIFDFSCLAVSIILAFSIFEDVKEFDWTKIYSHSFHHIGLGTVVTTIISAPIINLVGKLIDFVFGKDPLCKPLYKLVNIESKKKSSKQDEQKIDENNQTITECATDTEGVTDDTVEIIDCVDKVASDVE